MQRFARAILAAGVVALLTVASAAAGDANGKHDRLANADVRSAPAAEQTLHARAADLSVNPSAAADALKDSLGAEGIVSLDPLTKTAASSAAPQLLTGPSRPRPRRSRRRT